MELMKLVETGIIQHTKEKDLPLAEICPVDLRSTERQLRNADLILTYKVVAAGYAIALLVFLLEAFIAYVNRKELCRKQKTSGPQALKNAILFAKDENSKMHYINGRNYYVVVGNNGDQRLIPVRTPSAVLFQYTA